MQAELVLGPDGEIPGVADLETAGLIEAGHRPLAVGVGRVLREDVACAAAVGSGVGVGNVVERLRPGVVGEQREAAAEALVHAEIEGVVLQRSAARIELVDRLSEEVLIRVEQLQAGLRDQCAVLRDAPLIRSGCAEVLVRLDGIDDRPERGDVERAGITSATECAYEMRTLGRRYTWPAEECGRQVDTGA